MKRTTLYLLAAAVIGPSLFASADDNDPVIMTIGGKPVNKSEFEYLYHKNAGQQVEPRTIDEYADMFVNYKLKVLDAEAAGIDTAKSFKDELSQYRAELAQPYMRDKKVDEELLQEAYDHYKHRLRVSHLMTNLTPDGKALIDSLRNEIVSGRLDWDEAVAEYTIDRGSRLNGGDMGWMPTDGTLPWPFEEMAYKTKTGEISEPVNSGYGYHIIKVTGERENEGEVSGRHILRVFPRGASDADKAAVKAKIDSIYSVLTPENFAQMAEAESEDPGSAKNGGDLGWFGRGRMVPQFEDALFDAKDGDITKPFETRFGWHIAQRTGSRPAKSFDEMKTELQAVIDAGERSLKSERSKVDQLLAKYNSHLDEAGLDKVRDLIKEHEGGYDEAMIEILKQSEIPVAEVNGKAIPMKDIISHVAVTASKDADNARRLITSTATREMELQTVELERINMADDNPDYRNLVNEYRDGILLFEISNQKVWERAAHDRKGLETFYKKNKKNYTFDEPRFKGYVVFAPNDSVENAIKDYLATVKKVDPTTFGKQIRDKFGKGVKVERVIAKKGENPITDYLGFGGERPDVKKTPFTNYFAFRGKIVDNPEEVDDIRGQVIADYQNALEAAWIKALRKKYPVVINREVLETVK